MTLEDAACQHFTGLFPDFAAVWAAEDLFREEDGSFTLCGLFVTAATFIRERVGSLTSEDWREVGAYINHYFALGDEVTGILGACFVENLEGYEFSRELFSHVAPEVLRLYQMEL